MLGECAPLSIRLTVQPLNVGNHSLCAVTSTRAISSITCAIPLRTARKLAFFDVSIVRYISSMGITNRVLLGSSMTTQSRFRTSIFRLNSSVLRRSPGAVNEVLADRGNDCAGHVTSGHPLSVCTIALLTPGVSSTRIRNKGEIVSNACLVIITSDPSSDQRPRAHKSAPLGSSRSTRQPPAGFGSNCGTHPHQRHHRPQLARRRGHRLRMDP